MSLPNFSWLLWLILVTIIIHRLLFFDSSLQWTSYLMPTWKQSITWYCLAVVLLSQPAATGNNHYFHHSYFIVCQCLINEVQLFFSIPGIVAVSKEHARTKRQSCTPGPVMLRPLYYLKVGGPLSREHLLQLFWTSPSLTMFNNETLQQHWRRFHTSEILD